MNIYLVERTDKIDYDQYTGFVCVAESENQARLMNPTYDGEFDNNLYYNFDCSYITDWVQDPNSLKVTKIGKADYTLSIFNQAKIILYSYNAG